MSVLIDIVLAKASEAQAVLAHHPQRNWPHLGAQGLDPLKLGDLYAALLNDDDADAGELSEEFEPIDPENGDDSEGPWLMAMPAPLLTLLLALPAEQAQATVTRWLAADEPPDWPKAELSAWLLQLRSLVQRVQADASSPDPLQLYLWISL